MHQTTQKYLRLAHGCRQSTDPSKSKTYLTAAQTDKPFVVKRSLRSSQTQNSGGPAPSPFAPLRDPDGRVSSKESAAGPCAATTITRVQRGRVRLVLWWQQGNTGAVAELACLLALFTAATYSAHLTVPIAPAIALISS